MMLIMENIKLALSSIKANKMRSFLTMLGVIIGISSVITIASLGDISKRILGKEFDAFGKNRVLIMLRGGEDIRDADFFSMDDIHRIRERFGEEIEYIAPETWSKSEASFGRQKAKLDVIGAANGLDKARQINVIKGRFLTESDVRGRRHVGVADKEMAEAVFGTVDAVGREVRMVVDGEPSIVMIVGVYERTKSLFSGMMKSDSTDFYMPYTLFPSQNEYMWSLDFKVFEDKSSVEVAEKIEAFVAKSKGREPGFYRVESTEDQQSVMDGVLGKISMAIGAIAAISLIVGGIGIMNIMLVSVTERTKEIGIRKSLGARRKDILLQFLVEAMIVSATGGIIGTGLGLTLSSVIAIVFQVPPVLDFKMVVIAVIFSAVIGMFFGIMPANRAAKLDPIDALRYE